MRIDILKKYVEILKTKGEEIVGLLENTPSDSTSLRDLIINFNNIFSNVQQYELLIADLEEENSDKETE